MLCDARAHPRVHPCAKPTSRGSLCVSPLCLGCSLLAASPSRPCLSSQCSALCCGVASITYRPRSSAVPHTLHHTPYTLHPTPYTLQPLPRLRSSGVTSARSSPPSEQDVISASSASVICCTCPHHKKKTLASGV